MLLVGLVAASVSGALRNGFVNFDDNEYVYENAKITGGLTSSAVAWEFTNFHAGNWHPLTTISHMLDCQLFGLQPWGHHLTSILLHAVAAVLLFLALRELTSSLLPSAFVAAVFAIHPLRVESVVWISERKDVLSGVFFALTLLAYAHYARGKKISWYFATIASFAAGLMSKPSLVPLPLVLLLLDYWPLERVWKSEITGQKSDGTIQPLWPLIKEKTPLFALSLASCAITVAAQAQAISEMQQVALPARLANALVSYVVYLGEIFDPTNLAAFHLYPRGPINPIVVIASAGLLVVVSILCWIYRKRWPFLIVGWLWYVGMLVPVIGIVQVGNQAHADRYTYLPSIGVYIAVGWLVLTLTRGWQYQRQLMGAVASLILILLIPQTRAQTSFWRSSVALWQHAAQVTENNYQAFSNLGISLLAEGRINEAIAQHQRAIEIEPNIAEIQRAFADALLKGGRLDDAIAHYQRALQIRPNFPDAERNLGDALLQKGRTEEAIEHYRHALAAKPDYPEGQNNLGNALANAGRYTEAAMAFQEAVRLKPDFAEAHSNFGSVLMIEGRSEDAVREFRDAVRFNQNYAEAHYNLALALAKLGQRSEAIAELNEALRIKPGYPAAERALRMLQSGE